ncbi:hypothetical protein V1517DRAFT_337402 [Lipomyces orientalis]|uniref:Uncharacterized protein n=1 Tax=Lipomyces orientalis TaxID=1233043 RepID=A0ACC3TRU9_9ASCO
MPFLKQFNKLTTVRSSLAARAKALKAHFSEGVDDIRCRLRLLNRNGSSRAPCIPVLYGDDFTCTVCSLSGRSRRVPSVGRYVEDIPSGELIFRDELVADPNPAPRPRQVFPNGLYEDVPLEEIILRSERRVILSDILFNNEDEPDETPSPAVDTRAEPVLTPDTTTLPEGTKLSPSSLWGAFFLTIFHDRLYKSTPRSTDTN